MSELNVVKRGGVEDIFVDVYDLTQVEPQPGNDFVPGFYYNIIVNDDGDVSEVKAEQQVRLAGPYATSNEALAAGKAFVRDALDGAPTQKAA